MIFTEFPAYSQIYLRNYNGQLFIVTAAVHQGLDSSRKALLVTFWHWASVAPYTSPYGFAESCVFGKQSPGIFNCGLNARHEINHDRILSKVYPEVTPAVLPSSLRGYHPITLVYSTYPPELVCGTVTSVSRNEHFLGS